MVRWRAQSEQSRPWDLLYFGFLSAVASILFLVMGGDRFLLGMGLLLLFAGAVSIVRGIQLLRVGGRRR